MKLLKCYFKNKYTANLKDMINLINDIRKKLNELEARLKQNELIIASLADFVVHMRLCTGQPIFPEP